MPTLPQRAKQRSSKRMLPLSFLFCGLLGQGCQKEAPDKTQKVAAIAPSVPKTKALATTPTQEPRLVILGFDGMDPRHVRRMIKAGSLPNLAALAAKGHMGPLATTNPPQSPVAWSAFATGALPGMHGIFDFVGRNPKTYMPKVATTSMQHAQYHKGVYQKATAKNLRSGASFWDEIARAHIPVRALHVPYAYPPAKDGAEALGGLGMPDVRGVNSSFTLFTTSKKKAQGPPPAGGRFAHLRSGGAGVWRGMLVGPRIVLDGKKVSLKAAVRFERLTAGRWQILMAGDNKSVMWSQKEGATPYVSVKFIVDGSEPIHGQTRFVVHQDDGTSPEIYAEPIGISPKKPYLPASEPKELAEHLWQKVGPYKTVGWVHDTSALQSEAMHDARFLAEAWETLAWRKQALLRTLKGNAHRLVVSVFTAADRIGHLFYRHMDAAHPAASKKPAPPEHAAAMDEAYMRLDAVVGETMALLGPKDVVLVMSDHGFDGFYRGFHLNAWLKKAGYLVLKPGVSKARDFFLDVDWSKTKAYALGTGGIFINQRGRERDGIVSRRDRLALIQEIATKIRKVKDRAPAPWFVQGTKRQRKLGRLVVAGTYVGDTLYAGDKRSEAPDLRIALAPGYRASWATTLGGMGPGGLFENNTRLWSGDHASARPEDVPGVLLASQALQPPAEDWKGMAQPRIEDLAATAYAFFGVAPPPHVIGRALLAPAAQTDL